jgi:hypothetical protein
MTSNSEFNPHEPDFNVLHRVADGLYTVVTPFLFDGRVPLQNRSILVHAPRASAAERGRLAVINPVELDAKLIDAVRRLENELNATVCQLISPGDWHYLFIGAWLAAFPESRAFVPPGRIPAKKPGYDYTLIDVERDHPFPELAPQLLALNCKGLLDITDSAGKRPRHELIFYFPAARAITSGDVLYYNGVDELHPAQQAIGQRARVVDFHFMKWRMIAEPAAFARSLALLLQWDFDRYISIHGQPGNMLAAGARADIERLVEWIKTPPVDFVVR